MVIESYQYKHSAALVFSKASCSGFDYLHGASLQYTLFE